MDKFNQDSINKDSINVEFNNFNLFRENALHFYNWILF